MGKSRLRSSMYAGVRLNATRFCLLRPLPEPVDNALWQPATRAAGTQYRRMTHPSGCPDQPLLRFHFLLVIT